MSQLNVDIIQSASASNVTVAAPLTVSGTSSLNDTSITGSITINSTVETGTFTGNAALNVTINGVACKILLVDYTAPSATSFKFSVKTDNSGTSGTNQFTIPTTGSGYNYTVVTSEQNLTGQTGDVTLTWSTPGTYDVEISGDFPRIYFNCSGDKLKMINIERWGSIAWSSFNFAFFGCENLDITATDSPDLSLVTDMSVSFNACTDLTNSNGSISNWDVSNVTNMGTMFAVCYGFNVDVSSWDVSNVTDMSYMFNSTPFNQNIGGWTVSHVVNMEGIFSQSPFDQDISSWDVSSVTNMTAMFDSTPFNQNISSWVVSNVSVMDAMFINATSFNQDLSGWDVALIPSAPVDFDLDATSWVLPRPNWSI